MNDYYSYLGSAFQEESTELQPEIEAQEKRGTNRDSQHFKADSYRKVKK